MRLISTKSLLLIMIAFFSASLAYSQAFRCPNRNYTEEKCEEKRAAALEGNCASADEIAAQKAEGYYPECMGSDLFGWCKCGCFVPGTKILTQDEQWQDIETFAANQSSKLVRVDDSVRGFDDWLLTHANVKGTTVGTEVNDVVRIVTEDAQKLTLTKSHAVLLASGVLVKAIDLKADSVLVNRYGESVKIAKLELIPYDGLVYNVETDVKSEVGHIIIAEGVAVGDLAWQNQLENELNRIKIRAGK